MSIRENSLPLIGVALGVVCPGASRYRMASEVFIAREATTMRRNAP